MQLQRAFKVIKSIQRGVVSSSSGGTVEVVISPVNLLKATLSVGGWYTGYQTSSTVYGGFGAKFDGSGKLVFEKSNPASTFKADWEVIEYV